MQRQYSGTAERVENCQLGVFLAYATDKGRTLIDRELYLPKSWPSDRERCREAAVPDEVEFATKTTLAKQAYGQDYKFRAWCEQHRIGYVVAVPRSQSIPFSLDTDLSRIGGSLRADDLVARAPDRAWKCRSAGPGVQGERFYDWAVASQYPPENAPTGWGRWLLVRRQILTDEQPQAGVELELAYYLCAGPPGTTNEDLIRVAGTRWAIEECFQTAKNEVGLDQYQVRRYDAWYRHITLALLAHAYLSVTAAIAPRDLLAVSARSASVRWSRTANSSKQPNGADGFAAHGRSKLVTPAKGHAMSELLVDFITSLDGYASGQGWPGFWGLEGPEYLAWLGEQPEVTYLMGANTYRQMSGFAAGEVPNGQDEFRAEEQASVDELTQASKVVFSSSLEEPLTWANSTLIRDDAVEAVRAMKENNSGLLSTIGSLSLCRSLLRAGLVDRFRVGMFPVITGATGAERIYDGYPDVALEMIEHRTFDGRIQLVEYKPRVLEHPPLGAPT